MKYVCSICGYVYDEAKEGKPFAELPDSWVCPICGAAKSAFRSEQAAEAPRTPAAPIHIDEDMKNYLPENSPPFALIWRGDVRSNTRRRRRRCSANSLITLLPLHPLCRMLI